MSIVANDWIETSVLITVKTYPTPSKKYRELVCTAGITEAGEWIRLYPVPYRYLNDDKQYSKYSWVHARIQKKKADHRPDSYVPDIDSLTVKGTLDTKDHWKSRNRIILPTVSPSLEYLKNRYSQSHHSLGIFKPKQIVDLVYEKNEDCTSSRVSRNLMLNQMGFLDGTIPKELEPMPYNFYYKFFCDDTNCNGHKLLVIDWEIFALYRKERRSYGEHIALKQVKEKWLNQICASTRDTHFIVGTDKVFGSFMILGVYWPPKTDSFQTMLF